MSESNKVQTPVISFDKDGNTYLGSAFVDADPTGTSPSVIINISDLPIPDHEDERLYQ